MTSFDKIDLYIDGLLSPEEKAAFIEELKVNKVLKKEFDERLEFHNCMKKHFQYPYEKLSHEDREKLELSEEDDFKINEDIEYAKALKNKNQTKIIKSFLSFYKKNHKFSVNKNIRLLTIISGVAAGLIIIIFLGLGVTNVYTYLKYNKSSEIAFNKFFTPQTDPFIIENKPEFIVINSSGLAIDKNYDLPDYYRYDEVVRGNNEQNLNVIYFALIDAQNEKISVALQSIRQFLEYNDPFIYPEINLYYALLLLKDNNYNEAIEVLLVLSEMENDISAKAEEILKLLNPS